MSRAGKGSRAKLQQQKEDGSIAESEKSKKAPKITVWPEFNENDVSSEKWDVKSKEKGKGALFEDPDGMVELPPCLSEEIETWKRPSEFITDKTPVVVEAEKEFGDLVIQNLHLLNSELMRWLVCHVDLLWQLHNKHGIAGRMKESWKPWDHIYPKPKGQPTPNYNPCGKYCVKVFWLGLWRKVTVDDLMPFNKGNEMLLPMTRPHELWLPLLTKALLKVVTLDCDKELDSLCEFGDNNVTHMLTGWVIEAIPVRTGHKDAMWNLFSRGIPSWTYNSSPDIEEMKQDLPAAPVAGKGKGKTDQSQPKEQPPKKEDYPYVLFASYGDRLDHTTATQEQAMDDSVAFEKIGLPAGLPHVVMVTQTRRESLEQPVAPDPDTLIPKFAHQGFKSRKQREQEAQKIAEELKSVNCKLVEVISPLMNLHRAVSPQNMELLNASARDPPQQLKIKRQTMPEKTENGENIGQERKTSTWIQYDNDFIKCFTTLYVLHKPGGYKQKQAVQDMKNVMQTTFGSVGGLKKDKGASGASASNLHSSFGAPPFSRSHPNAVQVGPNGTLSCLLCVDSIKAIEIILNLSTVTYWPYKGLKKNQKTLTGSTHMLNEVQDDAKSEVEEPKRTQPALLIVEEYQWDTVVAGQPLLTIKTTGTKAAALCLPPGRHLIRLHISAPICFHLELWSATDFIFQEEDEVLHELTKESLRYRTHAVSVLSTIVKVVGIFDDISRFRESFEHQGLFHRGRDITVYHCQLLYASLMDALGEYLSAEIWTKDTAFSWKAFFQEGLRVFLQGLEKDVPKAASTIDKPKFNDLRFPGDKQKGERPVPENWIDRVASEEEHQAATKIQACFKGYWQYKLWKTVTQGSPEHIKAHDLLDRSIDCIMQTPESMALTLFRTIFTKDPQLLTKFPFKDDEWSRCCFEDHTGHYKEQSANCAFLMFRETFYVQNQGVLIVPHLYTSVPTCSLRVLNNDTGEEIPRVFQHVSPHIYMKNQRGYTFVAEGRSGDEPIPEGKCRLRLIGSDEALLRPKYKGTVNCEFFTKELKEYYLPSRDYEFFRLAVKVTEDMVVTLQLETSKESAYIKLQILDTVDGEEREVKSASGRGYAIIPAFTFLKDGVRSESPIQLEPEEEATAASSTVVDRKASQIGVLEPSTILSLDPTQTGRASSRRVSTPFVSTEPQHKPNPEDHDSERPKDTDDADGEDKDCDSATEGEFVAHKYILHGMVERNSWPESESAWDFVSLQKASEKQEVDSARTGSSTPDRSNSAAPKKGKAGKNWTKTKLALQATPKTAMQFDNSVPHWIMKVVTLEKHQTYIDVKRDTEREDKIKAIKQAWEAAEPGRASKAKAARQTFLDRRMSKSRKLLSPLDQEVPEKVVEEDGVAEAPTHILSSTHLQPGNSRPDSGLISQPSSSASFQSEVPLPIGRKISQEDYLSPFKTRRPIRQVDYSAFARKCPFGVKPKLLDDEELQKREAKQQEEMERFRSVREAVLDARERDRQARNRAKIIQLETAEQMQMAMDEARNRFNQMREAYRQKYSEEQQRRVEVVTPNPPVEDEPEEMQPKPKSASRKGKKK